MANRDDTAENTWDGTVRQACASQITYCRSNGAPITGRVVTALAALLDAPGPGGFIARIRDWPGGGAERMLAAAHAHSAWIERAPPERPPA